MRFLWQQPDQPRLKKVAFALIAGGALGNAYDGFARGFVVDMLFSHNLSALYRPLFGTGFPIFNLSDVGVLSGVALLLPRRPITEQGIEPVTLLPMFWLRLIHIGSVLVLAAPAAAAQEMYTVQPGDTLTELAEQYGVTVDEILAANMLTGSDLMAGATLKFPDAGTYIVKPGDTLSDVALETGVSVEELMVMNNLSDTSLVIGQKLMLGRAAPSELLVVEVEPGDSIWSLAERYGVPVSSLSKANGLADDAMLEVGETLTVPDVYAEAVPSDRGGGAEPRITVESGRSLSEIAERHGTTVDALMALNDFDSELLTEGTPVRLPPGSIHSGASDIVWPLQGVITSYFGPRELLGMTFHYGLDIDGVTGDPVVAAMAGTVTYSGWQGGYGYLTVIEANGVQYFYGHASELLTNVGQSVATGELVARVGATGRVTGSHLHFEARINGQAVNPLPYLERTSSLP